MRSDDRHNPKELSPITRKNSTESITATDAGNRFGAKNVTYDKILAQSLNAEPFYRRAIKNIGWHEVA